MLVAFPVIPEPAATFALNEATQPALSVILITCAPAVTLTKVWGDGPGTTAPPSNCQVNGAVPDNAVAVMVPSAAAPQDVAVVLMDAVIPIPAATFTFNSPDEQPRPRSFTKIV